MTLVPIIYTSLIIFSVLLFSVIIISYLSFKMRSRNRKNLPSERIGMTNNLNISRPIALSGPKLNVNPLPAHSHYNNRPKYNDQVIMNERKVRKNSLSYTQSTNRKDSFNKNEESRPHRHNERTSLRATRLEIMNESNSFRKTSELHSESNHQSYERDKMVEANLFSYYDNNTESDFVLMDTTLLRQAQ